MVKKVFLNKKILIFALLLILLFLVLIFLKNKRTDQKINISSEQEKIKIAVCPTYYDFVKKIDHSRYEIIFTDSTAESITFLEKGLVDFILAGRTFKPEEPQMDYHIFKEGYSFLTASEIVINEKDLIDYKIFTDQDIENIKSLFLVDEIIKVDNVYEYLDKGIIITSWENTDYSRAEIVHLLENDGKRLALSRRPTLYCPISCNKETASDLIRSLK